VWRKVLDKSRRTFILTNLLFVEEKGERSSLKVRVDELPESGRLFHFHRDAAWFLEMMGSPDSSSDMKLSHPVNADLELVPERAEVRISGRVKATLLLLCSCCLREYTFEVDEAVSVLLLKPRPEDTPVEVDLTAQDLDTGHFDGETIDLDRVVGEELLLALPQKGVCSPECKGLCAGCGADLNREPCTCPDQGKTSPFAALKILKDTE
jgi:DUF177 domain-containing protein